MHAYASDTGYGAVLEIRDEKELNHPVCIESSHFNDLQAAWPPERKELYSIKHALEKLNAFLHGTRFTLLVHSAAIARMLRRGPVSAIAMSNWIRYIRTCDLNLKIAQERDGRIASALSKIAISSMTIPTGVPERSAENINYLISGTVPENMHDLRRFQQRCTGFLMLDGCLFMNTVPLVIVPPGGPRSNSANG